MARAGYVCYVLQHLPLLVLRNARARGSMTSCLLVPAAGLYALAMAFRYSYLFKQLFLVDLGGYDAPHVAAAPAITCTPALWHLFGDAWGGRYFLFAAVGAGYRSIELLFRNARWLEREAGEFFGFFFLHKADRRTLFTIPLFYGAPLRRRYPAVGFYEIFFCPTLKKLKFKHLSLQQ